MHLPKPNSRRFCATVVIGILLTSALTAAIMLNPAFAAWWDYSWQYRKSVTVDHAKVAGSLSSFPVLVGVTDADLASKAKSNGDDICFADLDGNKLDHEIELYSSVSGHLVAWVRVPTLSSVSDTVFYMYYGNPSASNQQNPAGVWDSNFRMVQHLEEASGTCNDSTSYHNNGRPMNGVVQNANGKIDGACDFDGTNDYTDVGSDASIDDLTQITVSAWIKMDAVGPGATIYDKNFTKGKSVYVHTSGYLCFVQAFTGGSPSPYGWWRTSAATLSAGSWYYVTVTYDSSSSANDPQLYLNGALCSYVEGNAPSGTALSDASYNATVGGAISALNVFTNGIIDEARVSSISRSSAWISTEYNNQLSPSTFYTVGTEEIGTPPPTPELTNESPRDGAVDVALNPTLSIHAKDYQGDLMTLIFSTNASGAWTELGRYTNVGEGTYDQTTVTMDSYNTRYYWRVCATDGTNWNNMTYTFKTMPTWWNPLWQYRKSVTVDHAKVAGSLSSFPVLVGVTDADLASKAKSNGDDICFADLDGNKLDHEIELYSSVSGHLVAWVRVPTLSSVSDTVFYMYYGNPSASNQQNPAGVWDSNFRMVQHLEEASGSFFDSTGNHNDGTSYGGVTQGASGKMNGAAGFDGSDDYVDVGSASSLDDLGQTTISAWIKMNALGASIYDKGWVNGRSFYVHDAGALCFVQGFTSGPINPWGWWRTNALLTTGAWYFVSVTYDGGSSSDDPILFVDGNLASSYEGTTPAGAALSDAGFNGLVGGKVYYTNGVIDEVHVSNVIRSVAWISTEYNNQLSPSMFYTVGNEQRVAISEAPVLADEYPRNGAINVAPSPTLSIYAKDFQSDPMTIIFSTNASGAWTELGRYTNVGEGTYDQTTVNMDSYSTAYYWNISATDGTNWTNKTFTFITMPEPTPWWDYFWQYRMSVTVDHAKVAADLSGFPVLVDVTDADLASKAQSNGNDIAFADLDGNKLDQ